ncbi:hypothetical protein M662_03265 [Bacillus sp. SB49]|uniref:hypothetical protein n=1 Tax=Bacillus sp. SB49 TaxID=1071080 RepID=UPI0004211590|nr:hypothetical protein [Bacillus sp. SB49]QHT45572.1 hypothetical protein M662_03265 [Bacillus sp. SB49]
MDEIRTLVKALTKAEAATIVQKFNIKVHGFQKNFSRAPEEMLKNFIIKELKAGAKPKANNKRKGKKYTTVQEVFKFISASFINDHPEVEEMSVEDLALKLEMDYKFSKGAILSVIYTQFPDTYQEHKEVLERNVEEGKSLLDGIVKQMSSEEKMEMLREEFSQEEYIYERLKTYVEKSKEIIGDKRYEEFKQSVNREGEASFANEVSSTPKSQRQYPVLAFLMENNRYKDERYKDFLMYVERWFESKKDEDNGFALSVMEEEAESFRKQSDEMQKELDQLCSVDEKNDDLTFFLQEKEKENQELRDRLIDLSDCQSINKPFIDYFQRLLRSRGAVIVTNDRELFTGTELIGYVESLETFHQHKRMKDVARYKNKLVLISRAAFSTSAKWLVTKRYLENNGIHYYELSGYDLSEYLNQIVDYLHRERVRT